MRRTTWSPAGRARGLVLALLLAGGCAGRPARVPPPPRVLRPPPPEAAAPAEPPPPPPVVREMRVVGESVRGRPLELHVRGPGPEPVLVLATIHGNEPAGEALARALLDHVERHPGALAGRRLLVMPLVNPDGREHGTRTNARGVDLNRNFAASNRRDGGAGGDHALSEPEAAAVADVVRTYRPARVLSLHQPRLCVDWDGPAEALAAAVAVRADLPLQKIGTRPGSFGAWAEEERLPLVTLELPPRVEALRLGELWARYGEAVLGFVQGVEEP